MRGERGIEAAIIIAWVFVAALLGCVTSSAATLRWEPNPPEDNIAFYTVYAELITGTQKWEVREGTSFPLAELLSNLTYLLSVSATSAEGLESERSTPISYTVPSILPPVIIAHPASTNLASGNAFTLSVSATSSLPISYQWRKNGQVLAGQTSATLMIPSASPGDSGSYTVVVSNQGVGAASDPGWVIVQDPPSIITQPEPRSIEAGNPVTLSVAAAGTNPQFQWHKNDQPIPGQTNATLSFGSVTTQNRGTYHVTISNFVDRVTTERIILTVNVYPVVLIASPAGTNLTTGGTIRLAANVTGTRPIFFEWFKDGTILPNATSETLVISPASTNHSGTYRVRISNSENWVTSAPAIVTVREPVAADGSLLLSTTPDGSLQISAVATPNTIYEVQRSDSLSNPNWNRIQDVTANSAGQFQVIIPTMQGPIGFIRTVRK
ncbi:MAG: immunoglobulin domain-containing protein [Limisphaerales bacterium]